MFPENYTGNAAKKAARGIPHAAMSTFGNIVEPNN
jgi:hypothetical protein